MLKKQQSFVPNFIDAVTLLMEKNQTTQTLSVKSLRALADVDASLALPAADDWSTSAKACVCFQPLVKSHEEFMIGAAAWMQPFRQRLSSMVWSNVTQQVVRAFSAENARMKDSASVHFFMASASGLAAAANDEFRGFQQGDQQALEDLEKEMCELRHALKDHAIAIRDIGTMSVLTGSAQRFQMSMKFSGDSWEKKREFTVRGGSYLYFS